MNRHYILLILPILFSCSPSDSSKELKKNHAYEHGEYLYRKKEEHFFEIPKAYPYSLPPYPWEDRLIGNYPKITKEFFRCKGSSLNPPHIAHENGEIVRYYDCGGGTKHSLPLKEDKEFIYPILIELLKFIQTKTYKRVVITCGHRCPDHNTYVDASKENRFSKHMMGAEVSFYVQGMEDRPEQVVKLIQEYYKQTPKYQGKKEFEFVRYEKNDTNTSTLPWYNKEIFIKLYRKKEGRNFDNRHPYPYLSIQVRHDLEKNERVIYDWKKATQNFLRY